jgi:hypothetical protein
VRTSNPTEWDNLWFPQRELSEIFQGLITWVLPFTYRFFSYCSIVRGHRILSLFTWFTSSVAGDLTVGALSQHMTRHCRLHSVTWLAVAVICALGIYVLIDTARFLKRNPAVLVFLPADYCFWQM